MSKFQYPISVPVSATAPSSPEVGMMWVQPMTGYFNIYIWDGDSWDPVQGVTGSSGSSFTANEPATRATYDIPHGAWASMLSRSYTTGTWLITVTGEVVSTQTATVGMIVDNGDGTWTATVTPDSSLTMVTVNEFSIINTNAVDTAPGTFMVSNGSDHEEGYTHQVRLQNTTLGTTLQSLDIPTKAIDKVPFSLNKLLVVPASTTYTVQFQGLVVENGTQQVQEINFVEIKLG